MPQIIIANIIDFLASMVQIYSGTVKEKGRILVLQILQLGMQTISMILLGAIPGAISNVLSCIRNYLCYKNVFTWPINITLIVLSFFLLGKDFTIKTIYGSLMLPTYGFLVTWISELVNFLKFLHLFNIVVDKNNFLSSSNCVKDGVLS